VPALCQSLRPRMRAILNRYRIPADEADDLVQTTLQLVIEHRAAIQRPVPWLLTTLRNHCALYWRDRRRRAPRHVRLDLLRDEQGEAADLLLPPVPPEQERREALLDLRRLGRGLPAQQRRLLELRHRLGLTAEQAAAVTGQAPNSQHKMTGRALANLRQAEQRAGAVAAAWAAALAALAAAPGAPIPWEVAAAAFALTRASRPRTAGHLAAAGAQLGRPPLAAITPGHLVSLRASLGRRGSAARAAILADVESFLAWAGGLGAHALAPRDVRSSLVPAGPPAARSAGSRGRLNHPPCQPKRQRLASACRDASALRHRR
jgi:RNA polymerase sigma factor (sigma-70 family)